MSNLYSGGVYRLVNAKAGNVADLSGGDNTSVIGYDWHGGDNQKWRFEKLPEGSAWIIQNVGSGKFLSIETQNVRDDLRVVGTHNPTEWDVRPDDQDGSVFRIIVHDTVFNLDLSDHGNPTPGTPLAIWGQWEGRNQCWRIEEA